MEKNRNKKKEINNKTKLEIKKQETINYDNKILYEILRFKSSQWLKLYVDSNAFKRKET